MLTCPFCERLLKEKNADGWNCECGECIPFGLEREDEENCLACSVLNCPRRK